MALIPYEVKILPIRVICFCSIIAFVVKLPVFPFHAWLPKAHVEAPTAGSIILAGVMLKLGGFGLVCSLAIYGSFFDGRAVYLGFAGVMGGVVAMCRCITHDDLKAGIAYSSVAHIRLVFLGAVLINQWGLSRLTVTIIRHGLTSSGLFCLVH